MPINCTALPFFFVGNYDFWSQHTRTPVRRIKLPSTLPYAWMCLIDRCNTIETVPSCSRSQRPAAVEVVDPSTFHEELRPRRSQRGHCLQLSLTKPCSSLTIESILMPNIDVTRRGFSATDCHFFEPLLPSPTTTTQSSYHTYTYISIVVYLIAF